MAWGTKSFEIGNEQVRVRTYAEADVEAIVDAIYEPRGFYGVRWGIDTPDKIRAMCRSYFTAQQNGLCNPIAYFAGTEVAGITRYMRIDPVHRSLEIGGTWIAPKWRRTFVNTNVKYLLLQNAIENLKAERVEFRVSHLNYPSQMGVLRIGATFEGRLRSKIYPTGFKGDDHVYSIIAADWPRTSMRLRALMNGGWPSEDRYFCRIETPRAKLRRYELADADALQSMVTTSPSDFTKRFPMMALQVRNVESALTWIAESAHRAAAGDAFAFGVWYDGRLAGHIERRPNEAVIFLQRPELEGEIIDALHRVFDTAHPTCLNPSPSISQ